MKRRTLFWLGIAVAIGGAAAAARKHWLRFAAMSDAEIRASLEDKLKGRVSAKQLVEIQDSVIARVRRYGVAAGGATVAGTVAYRERIAMPEDAVVVIRDPATTADSISYAIETLEGDVPASTGPCTLFIDPLGRPLSPVSVAGVHRRDRGRDRRDDRRDRR